MRRRDFITLMGGAAAAPILLRLAARAQQPAMPTVGFLSGGTSAEYTLYVAAVRQGLKEAG